MSIKLSIFSQRKLVKNKYKFVHTTFVTRDKGPAKGTIWFDKSEPKKPPRIVDQTIFEVNRVCPAYVWFEGGEHETLEHFLDMCDIGAYILIGVTPQPWSHTEI